MGGVAQDTERPEIIGFGYLQSLHRFSAVVDDNTGIRDVRLYDLSTSTHVPIHSEKPSAHQPRPSTAFYFRIDRPAPLNHRYVLEVEDFAARVTRSPTIEIGPSDL